MRLHIVSCCCLFLLFQWKYNLTSAEDSPTDTDNNDDGVVTLKQGKLKGQPLKSRAGNKYLGFLGVPYGKAPVRFGLPQDPDSWDGVRQAIRYAPHCYQLCLVDKRFRGVEDCLTLDIYTPKLDGKLPVMVEIHGGGFQFGGSSFFAGGYFMDEDVVLVVIQYRLGALGFLNTGDDVVPGNMGMKDQTAALKWVQENIGRFGGDPDKVTLFGFSAGGAAVHYHMISPMSKGLFRAAISASGSALNPWAFQKNPTKYTMSLAENVGCSKTTNKEMVECLREKSLSEILNGQLKFSVHPHEFDLINMMFCPSIEQGESEPKFLSDTPYKLVSQGKLANDVPWIAGVTQDEGAFYSALIMENNKSIERFNQDWYKMAPGILYYENSASTTTQSRVSGKVWEFYFGNGKLQPEDHTPLTRLFSDRFFVTGVSRAIREFAKNNKSPVYPYIFNFAGEQSIVQSMLFAKNSYGVAHVEELKYQFNSSYGSIEYGLETKEGQFSQKFNKLLISFSADGTKPRTTWGEEWKPLTMKENEPLRKINISWYEINESPSVLNSDPFKERTDFWESLPLRELAKEDDPDEKDEL